MKKIKSQKATEPKHGKRVAASSGKFMGIPIVNPIGKPRGTTVKKIREAVETAARKRA
jgi:hypothetical protein